MSLVIEDGSNVTGANSYITEAEYQAWADARFGSGRSTAPANDAAAEVLILRAMDYFEGLNFIGIKANKSQPLQWPRYDVVIDGYDIDSDEIPSLVKSALYEITYAEESSNSELQTIERTTRREKIGDIEVEYKNNSASRTISPAITHALKKLVYPASRVFRA